MAADLGVEQEALVRAFRGRRQPTEHVVAPLSSLPSPGQGDRHHVAHRRPQPDGAAAGRRHARPADQEGWQVVPGAAAAGHLHHQRCQRP